MTGESVFLRAALAGLMLVVPLSLSSCAGGGGGGSPGPTADLPGSWVGTWQSTSPLPAGSLELDLQQSGTSVTGTATFDGHPCFTVCEVVCQSKGMGMSGWMQAGHQRISFHGYCHQEDPHVMTGTYAVEGGACTGDVGTIELTRVGGAAPPEDEVYVGDVILLGRETRDTVRVPVTARRSRTP